MLLLFLMYYGCVAIEKNRHIKIDNNDDNYFNRIFLILNFDIKLSLLLLSK